MVAPTIKPASVVWYGVSWETYRRLCTEAEHGPRMTYDQGVLEAMSPRYDHESPTKLLEMIVDRLAEHLRVPITPAGSTTFASEALQRGIEPDACFYVRHHDALVGVQEIDLSIHPPPDLAIEVDVTSPSLPKLPIYAALGVPEVWRITKLHLTCLHLHERGTYAESDDSLAFPMLRPRELEPFLQMGRNEPYIAVKERYLRWMRERFPG